MARFHISIDYDRCVGSRICVLVAPAVFGLNENLQSRVLDPSAADDATIVAAAEGCPMMAISLVDVATGKRIFPPAEE
jgi:ferredoxin